MTGPRILIDLAQLSLKPGIDEFLPREASLALHGVAVEARTVTVTLRFRSGKLALYQYVPFNVHVCPREGVGEIIEITRGDADYQVEIQHVVPRDGTVELDYLSECGSVPAHSGLGEDIRELSLLLTSVEICPSASGIGTARCRRSLPTPRRAGLRDTAQPPVFVIGPYRTGTSITTWAVGQHPNIAPLEETGWVHNSLMALNATFRLANRRQNPAGAEYDLQETDFLSYMAESLNELHLKLARRRANRDLRQRVVGMAPRFTLELQLERSLWAPKRRWVDGTPEQTLAARILASAFDESQFLFMVRDPLSVMKSLAHFERAGGASMSPADAARHWLRYTAAGCDIYHELGPERVKLVSYSAITTRTSETLRDIFSFLGESYFAPSARAFSRSINSSSVGNEVFQPPEGLLELPSRLYERLMAGEPPQVSEFNLGADADFQGLVDGCIDTVIRSLT